MCHPGSHTLGYLQHHFRIQQAPSRPGLLNIHYAVCVWTGPNKHQHCHSAPLFPASYALNTCWPSPPPTPFENILLCKSLSPVQQRWCQTYGPSVWPFGWFLKRGNIKTNKQKRNPNEVQCGCLSTGSALLKRVLETSFTWEMITVQVSWILHAGLTSWKCPFVELWNLKGGKWIQTVRFSDNNKPFSLFSWV